MIKHSVPQEQLPRSRARSNSDQNRDLNAQKWSEVNAASIKSWFALLSLIVDYWAFSQKWEVPYFNVALSLSFRKSKKGLTKNIQEDFIS